MGTESACQSVPFLSHINYSHYPKEIGTLINDIINDDLPKKKKDIINDETKVENSNILIRYYIYV